MKPPTAGQSHQDLLCHTAARLLRSVEMDLKSTWRIYIILRALERQSNILHTNSSGMNVELDPLVLEQAYQGDQTHPKLSLR
jgi:hypothetical protein